MQIPTLIPQILKLLIIVLAEYFVVHKPLFKNFFFPINNLFCCPHCFYLSSPKDNLHHPPPRITEEHHLGSQQLSSRRPQEVVAGGVSQAHHWSSDEGPAARQSL